jgi:purine-binding chemotaxis protein CheW
MTQSLSPPPAHSTTVLTVRLGRNLHGIPIESVEEVLPALPVESVPGSPPFVRGVVFVRGHLIPVLAAAERLGLVDHQRPPEPQIVCLRAAGRIVGLEIDEAIDLIAIDPGSVMPADAVGAACGLLSGLVDVDGDLIRLIDAERVMDASESADVARLPSTA